MQTEVVGVRVTIKKIWREVCRRRNENCEEQTSAKSQENLQIHTIQKRPESAYSIPGSMANDNWTGFTSHPVLPSPPKVGHPNLGS